MDHCEETKREHYGKNQNKQWTNKKHTDQGQHQTRRSPSSSRICNMMDEISKELTNSKIQPIKTGNEETMGCFLWMDDVVLINTNRNTLQEMLDITYI